MSLHCSFQRWPAICFSPQLLFGEPFLYSGRVPAIRIILNISSHEPRLISDAQRFLNTYSMLYQSLKHGSKNSISLYGNKLQTITLVGLAQSHHKGNAFFFFFTAVYCLHNISLISDLEVRSNVRPSWKPTDVLIWNRSLVKEWRTHARLLVQIFLIPVVKILSNPVLWFSNLMDRSLQAGSVYMRARVCICALNKRERGKETMEKENERIQVKERQERCKIKHAVRAVCT